MSVSRNRSQAHKAELELLENRRMLTNNWGLDAIDAPEVWSRGYTGQGVVVAVIDSGIQLHDDLTRNLWSNSGERVNAVDDDGNGFVDDLNGWDFAEGNNTPLTNDSHGNHVFGIIGGLNDGVGVTGVAYNARVMPLRVFDDSGASSSLEIADAIRYAVNNGADVINLSLDGVSTRNVNLAMQYANDNDVLIVASAGNGGESEPSFPATSSVSLDNVISVGAHDIHYQRWTGTNLVGNSGAVQVDAPGVEILSATNGNGYATSSGTSSAAAHVAGIAALALSANPTLSVGELRNAIVNGATQRVVGSDSIGAVNAERTLSLVTAVQAREVNRPGDFNGDDEVNFSDFVVLAQRFGRQGGAADGDVDGNGRVGFLDFLLFSKIFNREVGASANSLDDSLDGFQIVVPQPVVAAASAVDAAIVDEDFGQ